jgi:hypothetical protein
LPFSHSAFPFRIPHSDFRIPHSDFRIPHSDFRHLFTNQRFGVILLQSGMDEKKI